jgi:hypothetical protein
MVWSLVSLAMRRVQREGAGARRDDLIRRDQQAGAFVAPCDELEEQMRPAPLKGQITELVDHMTALFTSPADGAAPSFYKRMRERYDRRGRLRLSARLEF